jgi:hypothetical protein
MPRPLDLRLDRAEGRRTASGAERSSTAMRRRGVWRAEVAIGEVIREALAQAGVDASKATRLCLADGAAAALLALPDAAELQPAGADGSAIAEPRHHGRGDALMPKILAMAAGFAGAPPPDFANASFAELFAWSLTQPPTNTYCEN